MQINWDITQDDINRLITFVQGQDNTLVAQRISRNINRQGIQLDRNTILKNIIMCLLTTQQRSGPNSAVAVFLRKNPFPLTVQTINDAKNLKEFVITTLQDNRLNRFPNRISTFFANIYIKLQQNNWDFIDNITTTLNGQADNRIEREKADEINDTFSGFGPKQSRNFLQALGLTRFEIPIDSRITSWLKKFGFPVALSPIALQDRAYYHLVSDGIQQLCAKAEIYPCILDAAIFSSFDNGLWTEENTIY